MIMKVFIVLASLVIFIFSCNSNSNSNEKLSHSADKYTLTIPSDSNVLYFPLDSLYFVSDFKNNESDSFLKSTYSEILFNLDEPILYSSKSNNEITRLLWIRAFDNPIVVMASKLQDSIYVNIKELEKDFYANDSFLYRKKTDTSAIFPLTKQGGIFNSTEVEDFFNQPSYDTLNDGSYKDVTMWVLEKRINEKYHCITRLYVDTLSLKQYPIAKKMYDIGSSILSMRSRWEW